MRISDWSSDVCSSDLHLTLGNAIFIGLSQVMALIPGASRSGITMTAGRMLGMERAEAARFSLLLSIPTIIGAAMLVGVDLYRAGDVALGRDALLAAGLAFLAGPIGSASCRERVCRYV